jgi:uncharacterized protein YxjI
MGQGGAVYVIRERLFGFGDDFDITDETGRPVFRVDGKVLSLRDRLVLLDRAGQQVAEVHRKLVTMRPSYEISIAGGPAATVRKKMFTPFRDRFTIDIPGPEDLEMVGSLFDHEYSVRHGDREVATVSKRLFSLRDTYAVQIADDVNHLLILAAVLAVDLAAHREQDDRTNRDG